MVGDVMMELFDQDGIEFGEPQGWD